MKVYNWHAAYQALDQTAILKQEAADFRVVEDLAFVPSGTGEHLYLRLRKTNLTTAQLKKSLQEAFAVPSVDVSFAGMKDKKAICEQWFSVRAPQRLPRDLVIDQVDELERTWHTSKLRRGQITRNNFTITLREASLSDDLESRLHLVAKQGVPNYFGQQRFGRNYDNVPAAEQWLLHRRSRRIDPFLKGIYLSTLRSLLFNTVLNARVEANNWDKLLPGDIDDSNFPTGPLWGRGRSATTGDALQIEQAALQDYTSVCGDLEYAGVNQARRSFVLQPQNLVWQADSKNRLVLNFALTPGCYATAMLTECLHMTDMSLEYSREVA